MTDPKPQQPPERQDAEQPDAEPIALPLPLEENDVNAQPG